jgi:serine/threonine protein kinase
MSFCLNPHCQKAQNPDSANFCLSCGTKLLLRERYRALKPIGQGGFGKTFLAIDGDKPSKPPCVIKQFLPSSQGTNTLEKSKELFNQEAVRLEELGKHSQIPELYAHFEQDSYLYLVQEYIKGQNLSEVSQARAFTEAQIRDLLISLLPVLQFVHDHQTIQRDEDQSFVLVDFGAARYATGTALLKTGTAIGDPRYMAPEQLLSKADFTSDFYCLGVTCLHLLTLVDPLLLFDTSEDQWVWRDFLTVTVSDTALCARITDNKKEEK